MFSISAVVGIAVEHSRRLLTIAPSPLITFKRDSVRRPAQPLNGQAGGALVLAGGVLV
jgi:hypothetical protein